MPPLLTIGLPVYNAAPFLEDALRSILAQTFTDWELIAVDDGSSDGSLNILNRLDGVTFGGAGQPRRYGADLMRRIVADGRHRGLGARLNQIVSEARGKYIARMDADDLMHPERLARQVAFLEQHPGVDVVGCGIVSVDRESRPISVRRLPTEHAEIVAEPLRGIHLAHATVVGRTEWWRKHSYNEENRGCEDWELWLGSYRESHFANLPDPLYIYREEQAYSLAAYARGKAELARVLLLRPRFSASERLAAAAGQWARIAAYVAASCVGSDRRLVRRRGTPPMADDIRMFDEALARIRVVKL